MSQPEKNSRTPLYTALGVLGLAVVGGGGALVTTTLTSAHEDVSASPTESATPSTSTTSSPSSSLSASPSGEASASVTASSESEADTPAMSAPPTSESTSEGTQSPVAQETTGDTTTSPESGDRAQDEMVVGHETQITEGATGTTEVIQGTETGVVDHPATGHEVVVPEAGVDPADQMVTGVTPVTPSYTQEVTPEVSTQAGGATDPAFAHALTASVYEHTVGSGDTLSHLAMWYGTSIQAIADYNNLGNPDIIEVGQVLYVPSLNVR